ncbi:hypothetical protein Val02_72260 [Virgisporangium aliadipatigenens]|uniref:Uncharacterized protein n=1 Tax=Virgisporangium aliadipatigenens TaxID=741659 RepID=A0A8J3YV00_9ACTN|nr:hypothetical protein [Virgisporangium aliadipatigenens]GIJ50340.1 hypothetical protein Val02_72260 [Virgisporangium aliadipatigenens]
MATGIRNLFRVGERPTGIARRTVGNAVVLHADDGISARAQALALDVNEDPDNDVVVLDFGDAVPHGAWDAMAWHLPRRRRRGLRLVVVGTAGGSAPLAARWLSERLNRTVIAPDGDLVRGHTGQLFVRSAPGGGWLRFRPGQPAVWDAKRYPAPVWDHVAVDPRPSSATAEIEPLPAGVWIHDTRRPDVVDAHRERVTARLHPQRDVLTVLLGCPGTVALSLDDVVRFWRGLEPEVRHRVRFVCYGDVRVPEGDAVGQALADLLGANVACYTGVPVGGTRDPVIRTVLPDGMLGWSPFARELGYAPRQHPTARPLRPVVLSYRVPLRALDETAERVFWFAPDAVVEVVQAGLWVRTPAEPRDAERIRGAAADPRHGTIVYDDSGRAGPERMRELAADLAARVSGFETGAVLVPASVLAPPLRGTGRAEAVADVAEPTVRSAAVAPVDGDIPPDAAEPASSPVVPAPVIGPSLGYDPGGPADVPWPAALLPPAGHHGAVGPRADSDGDVGGGSGPTAGGAPTPAAAPATTPAWAEAPTVAVPVLAAPASEPDGEPPAALPPDPPGALPPAPSADPPPVPAPAAEVVRPVDVVVAAPVAPSAPRVGPWSTPARTSGENGPDPAPAGSTPSADGDGPASRAEAEAAVQPVPRGGAAAILPGRALTEERAWLRRRLSREFDVLASSVSRLMSEHPGLQAPGLSADDVLTDAVALRLYLTDRGPGVDGGLRAGRIGPHVPLARCAVSGLSRLPSFRGAGVYRTSPSGAQWRLFRGRRVVTDWGFINALTRPCAALEGDTDVLIWSMTARRTALLEPDDAAGVRDRVLFLPGTNFKILELREPAGAARGTVLMREIGTNEIDDSGRVDPDRVALDELAVTSMRRGIARWDAEEAVERTGPAARGRFRLLPGLIDRTPS